MVRLICLLVVLASPIVAQDAASGATVFARHCATCHGADATGNGPMAPILTLQPTDLTKLRQKYAGFPVERVVMRIDGREPLVAHGSPMPVYGDFFEGPERVAIKAASGQPILVTVPVADLVAYLRSVQAE